jgi:hypothetical protein
VDQVGTLNSGWESGDCSGLGEGNRRNPNRRSKRVSWGSLGIMETVRNITGLKSTRKTDVLGTEFDGRFDVVDIGRNRHCERPHYPAPAAFLLERDLLTFPELTGRTRAKATRPGRPTFRLASTGNRPQLRDRRGNDRGHHLSDVAFATLARTVRFREP